MAEEKKGFFGQTAWRDLTKTRNNIVNRIGLRIFADIPLLTTNFMKSWKRSMIMGDLGVSGDQKRFWTDLKEQVNDQAHQVIRRTAGRSLIDEHPGSRCSVGETAYDFEKEQSVVSW